MPRMYPVGAGLYGLIVFLAPAFFGWLIGTVATLALLLARPRLGGGSWLVIAVAEVVWCWLIWVIQHDGSVMMDSPALSVSASFAIPLAIPTVAAVVMRMADRERRKLVSSMIPVADPGDASSVNLTTSAAEQGVAPLVGSASKKNRD